MYFQVHQPRRIKRYRLFDIGENHDYFDDTGEGNLNNRKILAKVAQKCYLPANDVLLELLERHPEFKVSFSFSGVVLDQFLEYSPAVLKSFRDLVRTGRVEVLGETYYHSLAFLHSPGEFKRQVRLHRDKVRELFGVEPKVFRNTELIYRNDLAKLVSDLGFSGMLMEGADHVLEWRSPAFVYHAISEPRLKLLLKHYRLSDDIAFRFGEKSWAEHPLTAPKYSQWINAHNGSGDVINLFMDYETFGEHQWAETGIFDFLRALPGEILRHPDSAFVTPSEAIRKYESVAALDVPRYVSWADIERDLSAWFSNEMQEEALRSVHELEPDVLATNDSALIEDWRRLQTSDHFYYMCTKWFADGDVHAYFNPYSSPYEAFIAYMNVINDMRVRIGRAPKPSGVKKLARQLFV
jgi:alpha-amylase